MAAVDRATNGVDFIRRFEKRLGDLTTRADSIQTVSQYAIQHKAEHKLVVQTWERCLRHVADAEKRVALFYVCNDIVQNCKRKGADVYLKDFEVALSNVMPQLREQNLLSKVERVINIWNERHVYPQSTIDTLLQKLGKHNNNNASSASTAGAAGSGASVQDGTSEKPREVAVEQRNSSSSMGVSDAASTFSVSEILSRFKSESLVEKIRIQSVVDSDVAARADTMKKIEFDASDTQVINHLKNKSEGKEFCDRFERSYTTLQAFVSLLEKQTEGRRRLIETLENAEVFYDSQYSEVKKIEPVYKKFLNNVNTVIKKTNERMDALPSPTYDEDAPTPSTNDGSEAMDIETTESSLMDDIAKLGPALFSPGGSYFGRGNDNYNNNNNNNNNNSAMMAAMMMNSAQMPPLPPSFAAPPPPPPPSSLRPPPLFGSPPPPLPPSHQQQQSSPTRQQGPGGLLQSPTLRHDNNNMPPTFASPPPPPLLNRPPPNFSPNFIPPSMHHAPPGMPPGFNNNASNGGGNSNHLSPRGAPDNRQQQQQQQQQQNAFNFPPPIHPPHSLLQSPTTGGGGGGGGGSVNQIPTVISRTGAIPPSPTAPVPGLRSPTSPTGPASQFGRPTGQQAPPFGRKRSLEAVQQQEHGNEFDPHRHHPPPAVPAHPPSQQQFHHQQQQQQQQQFNMNQPPPPLPNNNNNRPGMANSAAEHLIPTQPIMSFTSLTHSFSEQHQQHSNSNSDTNISSSRPISTIVGVRRSSTSSGGGGVQGLNSDPRLASNRGRGRGWGGMGGGGGGGSFSNGNH